MCVSRLRIKSYSQRQNKITRETVYTAGGNDSFCLFYIKGISKRTVNSPRRLNDKHVNDIIFWEKLIIPCIINIIAHARCIINGMHYYVRRKHNVVYNSARVAVSSSFGKTIWLAFRSFSDTCETPFPVRIVVAGRRSERLRYTPVYH